MVVGQVLNLTQCIHISPFMDLVCPDNPGIGAEPFYLGMVAARFGTALGFDFRARR